MHVCHPSSKEILVQREFTVVVTSILSKRLIEHHLIT